MRPKRKWPPRSPLTHGQTIMSNRTKAATAVGEEEERETERERYSDFKM